AGIGRHVVRAEPIATLRRSRAPRWLRPRAQPASFDAAGSTAAIPAVRIAVVALLAGLHDAVSAARQRAVALAAVGVDQIAVVALLRFLQNAVAAGRQLDVQPDANVIGLSALHRKVELLSFEDLEVFDRAGTWIQGRVPI